jgi:hypothetical protein
MAPEDIHDIRGPMSIPYAWLLPLEIVGAILLVAALVLLATRWWRQRRRAVPPPSAAELALARLERARLLIEAERGREFGIAVSEAVRLYIEDRFGERAAHRTTDEFLHGLVGGSASPLASHATLLEDFLRHCDLAKFARHDLSRPEMQSMHSSATAFVKETRPPTP